MQAQLFHSIFNKTENDWDTDSFLKDTIDKYPYFGLAHFYALKNTMPHENAFAENAARAALFFNNPFLLNAQLQKQFDVLESKIDEHVSQEIKTAPAFVEDKQEQILAEPIVEKIAEPVSEQILAAAGDEVAQPNVVSIAEKAAEVLKHAPKEEMLFEPLHATDYFASQGIKLSETVLNDDKLGKQLKSFTSWLKTMKKVHPDKLVQVSALVETAVQNLAEKSNIEEEVVTEAMAEAFAQQGKHIRAIDTYEKLSLLNPAKSAYFAAKIESLK
jgi:hypothetical protein